MFNPIQLELQASWQLSLLLATPVICALAIVIWLGLPLWLSLLLGGPLLIVFGLSQAYDAWRLAPCSIEAIQVHTDHLRVHLRNQTAHEVQLREIRLLKPWLCIVSLNAATPPRSHPKRRPDYWLILTRHNCKQLDAFRRLRVRLRFPSSLRPTEHHHE